MKTNKASALMQSIFSYMDSKADEYAKFDPTRAIRIYEKLQDKIKLDSYKIHIIGTNGKGSTGRFIAQSLFECNKSVLHFTSPHLFKFNERFYINDDIVSTHTLQMAHEKLQQFSFINESSYFEYCTFLALMLGQECDYLVMEAGIGGEFDSTSVLDYDACIFTKIGIDHREFLGEDISSIASTKLRAMQKNVFLHFLDSNVEKIAKDIAEQKRALNQDITLYFLKNDDMKKIQSYECKYAPPQFLAQNLALANIFLEHINIPLLKSPLNLVGRMQRISDNITIDVGHNEMAAQNIQEIYKNKKFILFYNSYKEKEIEKILGILAKNIEKIFILKIENNNRMVDTIMLRSIIKNLNIECELATPKCKDELKTLILKDKEYLVFGGFGIVEKFLRLFNEMD